MPEDDDTMVVTSKYGCTVRETVQMTEADKTAQPAESLVKPGTVIDGKYEILAFLGQGGMCSIYKAKQQLVDRIVALKMLHAKHLINEDAIERFKREGLAVCALEHPNIVKAYCFGLIEDKNNRAIPYMVMEYLEGTSLADLLKQKHRLSKQEALPIFCGILDALAHAHDHGIIHRDIKPANVMLVGTQNQVKLVDFGIAKILPESKKEMQKLTQTREIFGSLLYMSPEQCIAKPLDVRSDLYSMGCLMYEALDGDPPFKGDSSYDVMDKHLHASPRASEYLADDYFGSVILGALEKDPANRPQSAREFKEALLTLASTEKHVSNEPKQKSNANKWVTTIALVLFVVIAVALFYFRPQSQYHTTLQIEIADKRLHEYEKALSKAEKDYGPASTEAAKRLDDIASYLHLDQRKYAEAEPLWKRSLEIRERMLNVNPSAVNLLNVATSLQELAQCYFEQGKHAESTPLWERSLSIREKILGREDPVVATSVSALATNYCKQGHYKEAEPLAKRALAIFEKRFGPNDRHVLAPLFVLAECCQKQGKHAEAERLLNRAQSNQRGDVQ